MSGCRHWTTLLTANVFCGYPLVSSNGKLAKGVSSNGKLAHSFIHSFINSFILVTSYKVFALDEICYDFLSVKMHRWTLIVVKRLDRLFFIYFVIFTNNGKSING